MDKVICVGKNYLKHAVELGDALNEEPLFFLKPPSAIGDPAAGPISIPTSGEIHHEVELVLEIKKSGTGWKFSRYTVGLDLTIRDLQSKLKKAGQPWEKAKVFKNSAILGPWRELTSLEEVMSQEFSITVNGQIRQAGFGKDMRWKPEALIKDIEKWFPLRDGDILFTGTPEGVAELKAGDKVQVRGPKIDYSFTIR